jgi:hypothetical protein
MGAKGAEDRKPPHRSAPIAPICPFYSRVQAVGELTLASDVGHPPAAPTGMHEELATEDCLHGLSSEPCPFSPTG